VTTRAADRVLSASPAQAWFRRTMNRKLAALAYHEVSDAGSFRSQLDHLNERYQPVSLDDVLADMNGTRPLPDRAVLLTFDDGDRSVLEVAAPVLAERRISGVAFVVAGSLDSDEPHWWDEVTELVGDGSRTSLVGSSDPARLVRALKAMPDARRLALIGDLRRSSDVRPRKPQLSSDELKELERLGIEIGNHTVTHPCLPRCSAEASRREIDEAHARLTTILGHEPRAFAYPNGDLDERAETRLRELGYRAAFLFDHRLARLDGIDSLRISRVRTDAAVPLDRFSILVSGLHPAIHHLRGRH